MRSLVLGLLISGMVVALAVPAWAKWVWRDGRWVYEDPAEPPLPAPPRAEPPEAPAPAPPKSSPAEPPPGSGPAAPSPAAPPKAPSAAETAQSAPSQPKSAEGAPWWRREWPWKRASDDRSLFAQGQAEMAARNYSAAARTFRTLIKNHPASPLREEAMWLRAEALLAQREHFKAYSQYEELLTQYAGSGHYRDALLKEIEIAETLLGPERRRVLGVPLLSGDTEALEILRRVYEHQPTGDLADDVVLRIAEYHWNKQNWQEAEDYYDKYCREYPNGESVLHAELRRAQCAIERCRGPRYDVTSLQLAYDRLRQFQQKFPQAAQEAGVADLIQQVRNMQAESLFEIAARYRRAGQPLAAAFYAERMRERFPDSPLNEKARQFLADTAHEPEPPDQQESAK